MQGEKFDRNGDYIKKWCPELKHVPNEYLHKPWEMSEELQKEKKIILGKTYPFPIVKHEEARKSALRAFQELKK